ncbi:MAG TPA: DciA family protein [Xanthobacteraceae bacterium]|jgi:hypothetical protein|nr:DciA family protein [Xanthobacteraceae bacterium]
MSKPASSLRPLADVSRKTLGEAFAKLGFASVELVTRWAEIVGAEIAAHAQPEKIQWPRRPQGNSAPEPGTLVLRVEGPAALEVQHQSDIILQRVNQFFGWRAVAALRLRQAPLSRRAPRPSPPEPEAETIAAIAKDLAGIKDDELRNALAKLGAAMRLPSRTINDT